MTTTETRRSSAHQNTGAYGAYPGPVSLGGKKLSIIIALVAVTALAVFWRVYQQLWSFPQGLNSHEPEFTKYWLSLAVANMTLLPMGAAVWYAWMWTSAKRFPKQVTRTEEGRRIWMLWLLIAAFCASIFWGGSYFAEEDAAWHQIVTRDTAFTPSHDVLFYGVFPLMIYMAAGIFVYSRTRLPHLYAGKGIPWSSMLIISGTCLLFIQVAMNEFGHTFFQSEELFVAPLHWPFVLFGYLLAGTFAVWFETLPRIQELARQERELAAGQAQTGTVTAGAPATTVADDQRDTVAQT
jgi:methane/ammonia monooxygenase subunit C